MILKECSGYHTQTKQQNHIQTSYIRHMDLRLTVLRPPVCHDKKVLFKIFRLSGQIEFLRFFLIFFSGLGWTGRLWLNRVFLILRNKQDTFFFFC